MSCAANTQMFPFTDQFVHLSAAGMAVLLCGESRLCHLGFVEASGLAAWLWREVTLSESACKDKFST